MILKELKMKKYIVYSVYRVTPSVCLVMTCLSFLGDYEGQIPYVIIARIAMVLGAIAMAIAGILILTSKKSTIECTGKDVRESIRFGSDYEFVQVLTWCFFFYVFLRLDKLSMFFDFVMLFVFGIYYGGKIARVTLCYKKEYDERL